MGDDTGQTDGEGRYVEIMARRRPIAPGVAEPLTGLHELRVGPVTAGEIGWTR